MHIWSILQRATSLHPEAEAVVQGDRRLSYGELGRRVERVRGFLQSEGFALGDRVAVLERNSLEFLELYFAAAGAGLVLVPLNTRLAPEEIEGILRDAGSSAVFAARELIGLVPDGARTFEIETDYAGIAESARPETGPARGDGDLAHLYYTSGTTGEPKGVILTHRNVASHAMAAVAELRLTDGDTWGHFAPMFHLADAWATFAVTWVGGRHVMLPGFEAGAALRCMRRDAVTATNLVPTMLTSILAELAGAPADLPAMRLLMSGGAPIAPDVVRELVDAFGCEFVNTYGMTETSPYLTLSTLKKSLRALPRDQRLVYQAKTGRPFLGVDLRVVGPDGNDVTPDEREVGEIRVRGETVSPGYWNRPDATAAAWRDGWLCTGDLAVLDDQGYVTIVDRAKDVIITGGENVHSVQVENVLYRFPGVQEAAVFGVPDDRWGEAVVAAVVWRPGRGASPDEVQDHCREHLASFKCPKRVIVLDALPRTGSGKISKRALRDRFGA